MVVSIELNRDVTHRCNERGFLSFRIRELACAHPIA
jgi:hypothetical protein